MTATTFDQIFAYYDSRLPIGSERIIKRLQMLLNDPQSGHKEGDLFPFFSKITIKASPPIYLYILLVYNIITTITSLLVGIRVLWT